MPLVVIDKVKVGKSQNYSFEMSLSLSQITNLTREEYLDVLSGFSNVNIVSVILKTNTEQFLPGFLETYSRPKTLQQFKVKNKDYVSEISVSEFIKTARQISKNSSTNSTQRLEKFSGTRTIEIPALSDLEESRVNNMHLLVFLQTQKSGKIVPEYMITEHSSTEYELILSRLSNGELTPASKRSVFYATSLKNPDKMVPYTGAAHYHSQDNPGPDGYVGWMASHADGSMGQKLTVREVDNYKIINEKSLDQFNNGKAKTPLVKDFSSDATGTGLLIHAKSKLDFSKGVSKIRANTEIAASSLAVLEKQNKSFFMGLGNQTVHMNIAANSSNLQDYKKAKYDNYQGFAFGIDFLSMLKYRSSYGALLDQHHRKSNMNFVEEALRLSKVEKISITRRRVSNRPDFKNNKGTYEHRTILENSETKEIVTSSDQPGKKSYKGTLYKYRSFDGEIEEINLLALSPDTGETFEHPECRYSRQFLFKDFDIFHNKTTGTYTYTIEVEMRDGFRKMLKNNLSILRRNLQALEKYYQEMSLLSKSHSTKSTDKETSRAFLSSVVDNYLNSINLLEGKSVSRMEREGIISSISSTNLDLSSISKFLRSFRSLEKSYTSMLGIKNSNKEDSGKRSVTNLSGVVPGNITEEIKTDIKIKAFDDSNMIANYFSDSNANNPMSPSRVTSALSNIASDLYTNRFSPSRLLTVQGQKYEVIDNIGTSRRSEKKISEFETTDVTTKNEFRAANQIQKANIKQKIAVLESAQPGQESYSNKDELFFANMAQRLGSGISLQIKGKDVKTIADSDGGSGLQSDLSSPRFNTELQQAIIEATEKADSKDEMIKEVEKEYKNVVKIREKLGSFYEAINSVYKIKEGIVSAPNPETLYKDSFSGKGQGPSASSSQVPDGLDQYMTKLKSIVPGVYEEEVSVSNLNITSPPERGSVGKRYLLMKLESVYSKNVMSSNNLFFVEVE